MTLRRTARLVPAIGLLIGFSIPPAGPLLAAGPEMPVEGRRSNFRFRDQPMTFGPFQATEISIGWGVGSHRKSNRKELKEEREAAGDGLVVLEHEKSKTRQRRQFHMLEGDRDLGWVRCSWKHQGESRVLAYREDREGAHVVDHPRDEFLSSCFGEPSPEGGEGWILTLTSSQFRPPEGTLSLGDRKLEVLGDDQGPEEPDAAPTVGYKILGEHRTLAWVRVVEPEAVWIDPDAKGREREILAGAAAALLLTVLPPGY